MTNVKEFHCRIRMNLQSYVDENNQICIALFHSTEENVQVGPFEHRARQCPQNGLYRHYWFYSQLQKPGTDCFKCCVLRTCNFRFRSHLFLYQKLFCSHFNLKKKFFQFFLQCVRLLHFQKSYMNIKLRLQVGLGAPNFSGAPGLMWS